MKKIMFYLASAALLAGAVSCEDENADGKGEGATASIAIYSPDDLEEFDLDWKNQTKKLTFEWESDDESATYAILFSLNEDLSAAKKVEVGAEYTKDVTHLDFDTYLEELGVGAYKRGTLYWAIEATNDGGTSVSEIRSMTLFRFYKPFIDPRDNEEYRVCRAIDPMTGDYAVWLADNLRATKYSDGTELTAEQVDFYEPAEGEDASLTDVYGGYYTWTATMGGTTGAEEGQKIQGIAPTGWHIPTQAEWVFLINTCPDNTNPGGCLKDKAYWDPAAANEGLNNVGFNMPGAGYIWEPVGTNGIIESKLNTYYWTATAPQDLNGNGIGDEFPWNPAIDQFPNQGVTYGFNANDGGAALYPYHRDRGFSVRCVLD